MLEETAKNTTENRVGGVEAKVGPELDKELYELLFQALNDAIILLEAATGTVVAVNETFCQLTGLTRIEAVGSPLAVFLGGEPPFTAAALEAYIREAVAGGPQLFEWQFSDRRGRRLWLEFSLQAFTHGAQTYVVAAARSIQERQARAQQIQEKAGAMMALVDALQDVALLLDRDGTILAANAAARARLQMVTADCLGRNIFDLLPPAVAKYRKARFEEAVETGKILHLEDANWGRHILSIVYPLKDAQGEVRHVGIYAMDVTELRKTERELAKTKTRLQCLLDHVPVALYGCDPTDCGRLTYLSKSIERLTGFTVEEILGDPFFWCQHIHPEDRRRYQAREEYLEHGHPTSLEYRFLCKDGRYCWLHDEFIVVSDAQGKPTEFIGSLLDITATREAREALIRSEARYRVIVECQNDLIYRFDPQTTLLFVNDAVCRFLGKSYEELVGTSFLTQFVESDQQALRAWLTDFNPDHPVASRECQVLLPEGQRRWLALMVYAFFDEREQVQEFQAVGRDITERVKVEEALRQSEHRFRTITESSLVGIFVLQDGVLRYVNPAMARMFGYEPEEMLNGLNVLELVHPDHRDFIQQKIAERLAGVPSERYTVLARRRDGQVLYCELTGNLIMYEGRPAILVIVVDVTQRWQAEAALRASEEKFRLLVERMNDGLGIADAHLNIVYVNPRFCDMLGYAAEELLGRPVTTLVDDDNRRILLEQFEQRQRGVETPYQLVWTRKDGSKVPTLVSPRPIFDEQGRFQGSFAIMTDTSIYHMAEAALQRREQYFRQLTENVSDVIGLLDAAGKFTYLNPTVERLLGFTPAELQGRAIFSLVHPHDQAVLRARFQQLLQEAAEDFTAVVQIRHKQGTWHIWQLKGRNLSHDPVVAGIVINAQDITEQKKLEEALQQSAKKLRALTAQIFAAQETERRRLSLELHDELGQSLTALKLQLRSISNKLRKDQTRLREECSQMLDYINEVIENVRRLSHDLCPSLLDNVGLGAALRHLLENYRMFYKVSDNLNDLDDIDKYLSGSTKIHLYRIFQEILTNIEKHAKATAINIAVHRENSRLAITVTDNGCGFPVENLEQKASQTGLGLSAINERIHMLGGSLKITTKEKAGTSIHFSVPLQKKGISKKRG